MKTASPQGIRPNRVFKFAFLYVTAQGLTQRDAQARAVSRDHERRSKLELAGYIRGLQTGYQNDVTTKKRYRHGRQARQHIKDSFEAVVKQWRVFGQVVEKHRKQLPIHIQQRFSIASLREVGTLLQKIGISVVLDEADLSIGRASDRELSAISQAYILWCLRMAPCRGEWNDMHQLAFAWHMSPSESVKSFRTVVNRICKTSVCTQRFAKSWESVLSEKV